MWIICFFFFFFQAEDGIRDLTVTGVQTCALPIYHGRSSNAENTTQSYLGLNGGVNIDRWHFRHNGSFSWADTGRGNYQNISTYAQRDIADWSSQLILGIGRAHV